MIRGVLRAKTFTELIALLILGASYWPAKQLGTEFMPNLNEGTLFYMSITLAAISITKATELLQTQNKIIKSFPEVESVFGKLGRAGTATDALGCIRNIGCQCHCDDWGFFLLQTLGTKNNAFHIAPRSIDMD